MSDPVAGEAYTLTHESGLGTGPGSLPTGTSVTVLDVVPALTPGVGESGEETVLVSTDVTASILQDDGSLADGTVTRHLSFALTDFANLFAGAA